MRNRLWMLHDAGQSIWLDYIDRSMLQSGELVRRIERDALTGMTSNPTIFEKAMADGSAYDEQLTAAPAGLTPWALFELVETEDVRTACDIFRPIYERTEGRDGYVSIEVSPGVANDADATVAEAHRLWKMVGRPNVMIKVPGTAAGVVAVRRLIADGVNVNVTLLFSRDAYRAVIEAYLSGLEDRVAVGAPVDAIASVASFFVSRVDTEVDRRLEALAAGGGLGEQRLRALAGRAAIANAKLAYALFRAQFAGARWAALAARGARVQRPLWASTSTKNPAYRDVRYVEALIGPDTVNTIPPATLEAFRDHGEVRRTVDADLDAERAVLAELESLGISLTSVTDTLLAEGLASFQRSFETLLARLAGKMRVLSVAGR
jgi:transaldolase